MGKNESIISDSYLNLTAASSQYQDNWICDETWFRLLNAHYPHMKNTFNFTRMGLNRECCRFFMSEVGYAKST